MPDAFSVFDDFWEGLRLSQPHVLALDVSSLCDDDNLVSGMGLEHPAHENLRLSIGVVGTRVDQVAATLEVALQCCLMLSIAIGDPVTPKSQRMTPQASGAQRTRNFRWRIHQE